MFTERDAILFEMEELKVQARRDFEIYIDSRKYRNERYTELQDRLREIDDKERQATTVKHHPVQSLSAIAKHIEDDEPKPVEKEEETPYEIPQWKPVNATAEKLKDEMKPKTRKKREYVSYEIVMTKVIEFLIANGKSRTGHIQEYVEAELGTKWVNFSGVMSKITAKTKKVERIGNGLYKYNPREENGE